MCLPFYLWELSVIGCLHQELSYVAAYSRQPHSIRHCQYRYKCIQWKRSSLGRSVVSLLRFCLVFWSDVKWFNFIKIHSFFMFHILILHWRKWRRMKLKKGVEIWNEFWIFLSVSREKIFVQNYFCKRERKGFVAGILWNVPFETTTMINTLFIHTSIKSCQGISTLETHV